MDGEESKRGIKSLLETEGEREGGGGGRKREREIGRESDREGDGREGR